MSCRFVDLLRRHRACDVAHCWVMSLVHRTGLRLHISYRLSSSHGLPTLFIEAAMTRIAGREATHRRAVDHDARLRQLRRRMIRQQPRKASFYESVTLRGAAARCAPGARNLAVLDSEINAFNDLLATESGG